MGRKVNTKKVSSKWGKEKIHKGNRGWVYKKVVEISVLIHGYT